MGKNLNEFDEEDKKRFLLMNDYLFNIIFHINTHADTFLIKDTNFGMEFLNVLSIFLNINVLASHNYPL